jgi:WhiB family redox-sensing transcriptional regulator
MTPVAEDMPLTLENVLRRPAWHRQASCRGSGAAEFVRNPRAVYAPAHRQTCAGCPVRQECLEFALADESVTGLWGGTDDAERREMRRQVA